MKAKLARVVRRLMGKPKGDNQVEEASLHDPSTTPSIYYIDIGEVAAEVARSKNKEEVYKKYKDELSIPPVADVE